VIVLRLSSHSTGVNREKHLPHIKRINDRRRSVQMDFFLNTDLTIPMIQIVILLLFSTVAMLFGKLRLALLINYVFTLHWAYIFNRDRYMDMGLEQFDLFTIVYFIFGLGVVLLATVAFLFNRE
jgi:hypothetical protein